MRAPKKRLRSLFYSDAEDERRRHRRLPVQLWAESTDGAATYFNLTRDISEGGAFLSTECPLALGREVELHLEIPGRKVQELTLKGQVVRQGRPIRPGMGIEFIDLSAQAREQLRSALEVVGA